MSVTINVNNLSLVHKASTGKTTATLPDVCKTPSPGGPVPVPYPNFALSSDLMKGTTTIKADGGNTCAKYGSEFFKSTGDEAGTLGGVASSTFIKEATWMTFSFDVKYEGKGACRLSDKMFHNHTNTVNMAGAFNPVIYTKNLKLNLLCNVFCETLAYGKKWKAKNPGKAFDWSGHAEKLGKGKYAKQFAKFGMKAEASLLVRVSKSLAAKAAAAGRTTLGKRAVGKKLAGVAAKKIALKFIPVVNIISTGYDLYQGAKFLGGMLPGTKAINVKPDVAILNKKGTATEIFDYKFGKDTYRNHQKEIFKQATGKAPKTVNLDSCNYCKAKK